MIRALALLALLCAALTADAATLRHFHGFTGSRTGILAAANNAPVATDFSTSVSEGVTTNIPLVPTRVSDADGDDLTITAKTDGTDGTVAIDAGGKFVTYTSADPFTGNPDTFTYTVSDGTDTDVGTVTVTRATLLTLTQQAATMAAGEWRALDTANTFGDIQITTQELTDIETAGGSPNASIDGWGGPERVLQAYSGAGWDPTENRFLFFGGGHSSYGGNEVYTFDIDSLTWARLSDPAALTFDFPGDPVHYLPEDVSPADGVSDTPCAVHSYDMLSYNPTTDRLVVLQHQSCYDRPGGNNGAASHYLFNPATAAWTVHSGHDYVAATCEYIPVEDYSFCIDAEGQNSHALYLIAGDGTETDCGTEAGFVGSGFYGNLHYNDDTSELYQFLYNAVSKITIEIDDCAPTYALDANIPTLGEFGLEWDVTHAGVGTGYDGKMYLWDGFHQIVTYDLTTDSFDVLWHDSQEATGPFTLDGTGDRKIFSKWRCFETEGVCLGVADPDIVTNPRGGFWLWKPGTEDATQAKLGTLALDGSTQSTLSVYLPILEGERDYDSTAYVEYRTAGGGAYTRGVDLFRQRPELTTIDRGHAKNPPGYHGMITGLTPGTAYDVQVHFTDADGLAAGSAAASQSLTSVSTVALPTTDYTGFGTTTVTSAAQFNGAAQTACDGTGTGHVFTIPAATTITADGVSMLIQASSGIGCGTDADNPIVLRGDNPTTSKINCINNGGAPCVYVRGNFVTIENLTIESSDDSAQSGVFLYGPSGNRQLEGLAVRDVTVDFSDTAAPAGTSNSIYGITSGDHMKTVYIADNSIEGPLLALDTTSGGGLLGIAVPGHNVEIEHNTIVGGFVDAITVGLSVYTGTADTEQNRSIAIHHNLVLYSADDAIELDFAHRNVAAYHNLIANPANCLSFQQPWGGPAYAFKNICINPLRGPLKVKVEQDHPAGPMIWNNTFVKNGSGYHEGGSGAILRSSWVANNLFCGAGTQYVGSGPTTYELYYQENAPDPSLTLAGTGLNVYRNNAYCQDATFSYGDVFETSFANWSANSGTNLFGTGDVLLSGETVFATYVPDFDDTGSGFLFGELERDPTGKDYELDAGSSAVGAGLEIKGITDATPDIGACDTNDTDGSCVSTGTFYGVR